MKFFVQCLFLVFLGAVGTDISAQVSFSCTYREYCSWNDYTEQFVDCSGFEESSLFVMNESETMITHTTESIKSTYYVTGRKDRTSENVYSYDVTSDTGNKYIYIFDIDGKQVRAVFIDDKGETKLIVFYVKAIF